MKTIYFAALKFAGDVFRAQERLFGVICQFLSDLFGGRFLV
jgi:hypothetical protein